MTHIAGLKRRLTVFTCHLCQLHLSPVITPVISDDKPVADEAPRPSPCHEDNQLVQFVIAVIIT